MIKQLLTELGYCKNALGSCGSYSIQTGVDWVILQPVTADVSENTLCLLFVLVNDRTIENVQKMTLLFVSL